ncbi:hypothetical protein D9M71_126800 [compost metagenome]
MARLQHVGVLNAFARQPIGVVADQQLLFADQFPVVAIRAAIEAVGTVDHRLAEAVAGAAVIAQGRGATHSALPGVVLPRRAGCLHLVDRLLDQHHLAGITGGRDGRYAGEIQEVLVGSEALDPLADRRERFLGDHGVIALLLHGGGRERPPHRAAAVAGQVVPHHLHALGRLGEGYAEGVVQQAVAVRGHLHLRQVGAALFLVVLGYVRAAVARVDVHPVVGKTREHGLLGRAEQRLVLGQVGLGHRVQRFFAGEWIGVVACGADCGGTGLQATVPGRDTAVGIRRTFGTERGERAVEFAGVSFLGLGHRTNGQEGQGEGQFFHGRSSHQKLAFTVTEAKSRSSMVEKSLEPKKLL